MPKGKKSPHSNEDSAQPKIHKFKPKIKLLKKKKKHLCSIVTTQ